MATGPTVQVAGSLNVPAYQWPLKLGITLCVLSPIALGLQQAGWKGVGRLRVFVMVLTYLGPVLLLAGGVASLLFALAVRQARVIGRRDLEVTDGGVAIIDRHDRREFADGDVLSLGFRARSAPSGSVALQHGKATLMVDGRDGPERIVLDWEYLDGAGNPLEAWLGRLLDRLHARAVATIDKGGTLSGDGWELSRDGVRSGESGGFIPFQDMTLAEYHDGQLRIWARGNVEPSVRIEEGSKDEAVLFAVVNDRMPETSPAFEEGPAAGGLGRLLFERRWPLLDRFGLWFLCSLLAAPFLVGAGYLVGRMDLSSVLAIVPATVALFAFLPAWDRQVSVFRCHEGGVSRKGLFGMRELPFEDLREVKVKVEDATSMLKIIFKPIPGRGRKSITLYASSTDDALETLQHYVPGGISIG